MLRSTFAEAGSGLKPAATMHPVAIGASFGWLHLPADNNATNTTVLLCPGLGEEALTAHRQFRLLANGLARVGYATLRIDYPGTADSGDPSPEAELLSVWLDSIHTAADWLRDATGAPRLIFAGYGFGATLAGVAAGQRADISGVVLMSPVVRGRTLIRRKQIEGRLAGTLAPDGCLESHGLHLSSETVQAISALDLGNVALPEGCAACIFSQSDSASAQSCADRWAAAGTTVTRFDFAGLEKLTHPSFMSHTQAASFDRIIGWVSDIAPGQGASPVAVPPPPLLCHAGCAERPLRFGEDARLFGMLCSPTATAADTAILMVSSGGDPRFGFTRQGTDLARSLAAAGYTTLRMDFAGLGDSAAPGDAETHVFMTDRTREIAAGLDALEARGFRRVAVLGLCSGAYHSFRAALADERIGKLLLINLPLFEWEHGEHTELLYFVRESQRPLDQLVRKLWLPNTWWKLFKNRRVLRPRLEQQVRWRSAALAAFALRLMRQAGVNTRLSYAQAATQVIARRTRTLLVMAAGDPGIAVLRAEFGPRLAPPAAVVRIMPDIDHSLTRPAMRKSVASAIAEFLRDPETAD